VPQPQGELKCQQQGLSQLSPQVHGFGLQLKSSAGAGAGWDAVAQGELQLQGESQLKQPACALKNPPLTATSKSAIARIRAFFISATPFWCFKKTVSWLTAHSVRSTRNRNDPSFPLSFISASWFLMPYPILYLAG
jgi:hypothetical protein